MKFLNCSYGKEFYQLALKHLTCNSVYTRLSCSSADTPVTCAGMQWWCGVGWLLLAQVAVAQCSRVGPAAVNH